MSNSKYIRTLVLQYKPDHDSKKTVSKLESILIKHNVEKNTIVICPELSIQDYMCIKKDKRLFNKAISINSSFIIQLKAIAKKYRIILCITIFEKFKDKYFNKLIVINSEGDIILKYNKKKIPSESCYQEKFYFDNASNNFKFFEVDGNKIGVLICWDQWHHESYAYMKKNNINLIVCPTAIGQCKVNKKMITIFNEKKKWFEVIKSNSLMINTPVVICNRIGIESHGNSSISFWGNSFITDSNGNLVKKAGSSEGVLYHKFMIRDQITAKRLWNFID